MKPQRLYLVAGEASGDLHGSNLVKAIKKLHPGAEIRCWGGNLMQEAGAHLVSHYRERAFMGLWEVIKNLKTILGFLQKAKEDILQWKPDVLVLIDNPGFNMRLAKFAKKQGIPVHYYIAPKVWAWNTKRVYKLKKYTDRVYSILPFETEFFKQYGVNAQYVGNPVVDAVEEFKATHPKKHETEPFVALLPGSRAHEISQAMPVFAGLAQNMPSVQFRVAAAPSLDASFYNQFGLPQNVKLYFNQTYSLLQDCRAAVVTSGTATLETALFNAPQVVCYRVAALTYFIGKRVIKVPYISLVNLILNRRAVPELIQNDFNPQTLAEQVQQIWEGPARDKMLRDYEELSLLIGGPGASKRCAEEIVRGVGQVLPDL